MASNMAAKTENSYYRPYMTFAEFKPKLDRFLRFAYIDSVFSIKICNLVTFKDKYVLRCHFLCFGGFFKTLRGGNNSYPIVLV